MFYRNNGIAITVWNMDRHFWTVMKALCIVSATSALRSYNRPAAVSQHNLLKMIDPVIFFGTGDASDVTWAHGVNNQSLLNETLNDDHIMMIEADISSRPNSAIPWMAHDSASIIDTSLEQFLDQVREKTQSGGKKGVKLDFKSTNVWNLAVPILDKFKDTLMNKIPFWINADIVPNGPADSVQSVVNAQTFLEKGSLIPDSTFSIGWGTACGVPICGTAQYSWENVFEMLQKITLHATAESQPITFAVRAAFVGRSWKQFRWLLELLELSNERKSSLTVWTNIADNAYTTVESLLTFRTQFPANAVYYDLLHQGERFDAEKKNHAPRPNFAEDEGLAKVLEHLPTDSLNGASAPFIGSESVLLTNGQSIRMKIDYDIESTKELKFLGDFYFGQRRTETLRGRIAVMLRPGFTTGALLFLIQADGTLTLKECIKTEGSCQFSRDNDLDGPAWKTVKTHKLENIDTLANRRISLTAVDNVQDNKAIFALEVTLIGDSTTQPIRAELDALWPTSLTPSSDRRNSPAFRCDALFEDRFVVIDNVEVKHELQQTTSTIAPTETSTPGSTTATTASDPTVTTTSGPTRTTTAGSSNNGWSVSGMFFVTLTLVPFIF